MQRCCKDKLGKTVLLTLSLLYQLTAERHKTFSMTQIIFKSEAKAKIYEVRAAISFHIYSAGELIRRVKTDCIQKLNERFDANEITVTEIK